MDKKRALFLIIAIALTIGIASALITYQIALNNARKGELYIEDYGNALNYFELEDISKIINDNSIYEIDSDTISHGAMDGMVQSIGDGLSRYYPEKYYKNFDSTTAGSYIAIGMGLAKDSATGYCKVTKIYPDSPADTAGILEGELIAAVDGIDTSKIDLDCAIAQIRGKDGTQAELEVSSDGVTRNVQVMRSSEAQQVVYTGMLNDDIGYIDVMEFSQKSTDDFISALENMKKEEAKAVVIDLRKTPGGYISQATDAANYFLPEGAKISAAVGKGGERTEWTATKDQLWDKPVVILTEKETAGVAEVFASALQENGVAKIVGSKTAGYGVVFSFISVPNSGDGLKLVTAYYETPNGNSLNGTGITPDTEQAAQAEGDDAQLAAAQQLAQSLI